jgi:hypothetical protein
MRRDLLAARDRADKSAAALVPPKVIEKFVLKAGQLARLETLIARTLDASGALAVVAKTIADALKVQQQGSVPGSVPGLPGTRPPAAPPPAPAIPRSPENVRNRNGQEPGGLGPGELAILTAVVQYPGLDRKRLSVLVGYKRSSRDQYVSRLNHKGYLVIEQGVLRPTGTGVAAVGDAYEPLPTGPALVEFWRRKLPEGERKLLDALLSHGPTLTRDALRDLVPDYKRSSSDQYLMRLKMRGLVEADGRGAVRLAEALR